MAEKETQELTIIEYSLGMRVLVTQCETGTSCLGLSEARRR